MNRLVLPKTDEGVPYLSYSQIKNWKDSKRNYIREYFFGEINDNKGLQKYGDFGKKVGEALEHNDFSEFELDEQQFLKTVPSYDQFEREIKLQMDGFFIKGYIDSNTLDYQGKNKDKKELVKIIADYKTGDIAKKGSSKIDYSSEEYIQLNIYAAALRQELGVKPDEAFVYLLGRSGNAFNNEELKLTKKFITISRDISDEILNKTLKQVQAIGEEISEYYKVYLKLNKLA